MIVRTAILALVLGSLVNAAPGSCRPRHAGNGTPPANNPDKTPEVKVVETPQTNEPPQANNTSEATNVPQVNSTSPVQDLALDVPQSSNNQSTDSPTDPSDDVPDSTALVASPGFPYGQQKVRGVNLGGWLVLEPWITPSLFENTGNDAIVDEYTFGQFQDRGTAEAALRQHWDSWITEDDFRQIAAAGLNHVRLPIGYWAYDAGGDPYIPGQAEYVDRAVDWARNNNLKILLELHGAPGSQNGYDNSGQRGHAGWAENPDNVERAKNVLNTMAKKYQGSDVITGLGLLNEPATYLNQQLLDTTRQFWRDAYAATRRPNGDDESDFLIVISDGFQPPSTYNGWMEEPEYSNVAIDSHYYQVFSSDELSWDWPTRLQQVCSRGGYLGDASLWLFVGEWSLASTDCAQYLNGRGRGARYDGGFDGSYYIGNCGDKTGNGDNFSPEYKEFMRHFYDTQIQTYETYGEGWFYWCWKNERAADWSYQTGLRLGYIPNNPSDIKYPLGETCG